MPNERHLLPLLRRLPKVDEVLSRPEVGALLATVPRWAVVQAIRDAVAEKRAALQADADVHIDLDADELATSARQLLRPSLRPVLNATGVVLHTNLGRAPLAQAALQRMTEVAAGYSNLEYDLDSNGTPTRGSRHAHVSALLTELCGAEAALVVNNGAGAVLLALSALSAGREAIVSRGELVEIGGSFRVPDVMRASGSRLVEVGTTNRTHLADYSRAISADTAVLMKVHRSNFAQVGFVAEVGTRELSALGKSRGLRTLVDLGSGALIDMARWLEGASEPTVASVVADGADLVLFSGDKLLGGPQAGILVGSELAIAACRNHPLMRALRPDKLCLAALEATLELYRDGHAERDVPALRMLSLTEEMLAARAARLRDLIGERVSAVSLVRVRSAVGGGSLPLAEPWSWAVALAVSDADAIVARLRAGAPPLIARIHDGRVLLDVRTLDDQAGDETNLRAAADVVAQSVAGLAAEVLPAT